MEDKEREYVLLIKPFYFEEVLQNPASHRYYCD
ncbi:hypothetical protein HNP81_002972 [Peribacillus huizhouensis]|uniref:Uncharacterized protein n=1 Tax=Peribacillus huizhouensis TaxID=1501239 RepID=A0ABR6CSH2_9BACI|nr:hypothetical protein [Peribacillus huizhouensis]